MTQDDKGEAGDGGTTYRESSFVARPGETIRATREVRATREAAAGREADPDADEKTEEIRAQIEETRVEMSETVDAIQQKLSPDALAEQAKEAAREVAEHAKEAVREATVGKAERMVTHAGETVSDVGSGLLDTIRRNPLPAALAGLSLGWLFMNRNESRPRQPECTDYGYSYGMGTPTYPAGARRGYYEASYDERSRGPIGTVTEKVGETADQARETAGQVASAAGRMAGDVASNAGGAVAGAGETARDIGGSIVDLITENPLPAAVTGIGLAWLFMSRSSSDRRPRYAHSSTHYWQGNRPGYPDYSGYSGQSESSGGVGRMVGGVQERAGEAVGQVADKTGQVVDTAGEAASRLLDTTGQAAGRVVDTAGHAAGRVVDTAGQLAGGATYQAQRIPGRIERLVQENPLVAGALAVTVGAAVGLTLPETPQEDQLLGEMRDSVMGQARETVREAADKVQRVAGEAQSAVKEAAREEKLTV